MKIFKNKEKPKLETSKKVLKYSLTIETILLVVIIIGWFKNLQDAYQLFFGDIAFFIATVFGYFLMTIFVNPAKIKCGANILPDMLTMLGAMFNALNSGDIPSAISTIISASQMIVQNHPELTQKDNPLFNNNLNNNGQSNPASRGEGDTPIIVKENNNISDK